jgi:LasA protease
MGNRIVGKQKAQGQPRRTFRKAAAWALPLVAAILALPLLGACSRESDSTATAEVSDRVAPRLTVTEGPAEEIKVSSAGLPDIGSAPEPTPPPQVYTVQSGDTLSSIARRFGCTVDDLIQANSLDNPNLLRVGQQLQIPSVQIDVSPNNQLLPNSEFVKSPAYMDWDIAAFCAAQGGYLAGYEEQIEGQVMTGPEIVAYVAHHYSLGPRLLLAILELQSGWVTDPNPTQEQLLYPMGYRGAGWEMLHYQLAWAGDKLNEGYYDWRGRGMELKSWGDGTSTYYAPNLNAATAGLQYFFSLGTTKSQWEVLVGQGPGSFVETYRRLFGDPAQYEIVPLIPADSVAPEMALPWSDGELWFYTGGPHGAWNDGSAWAAVDFVPDEGYLGCKVASSWATAAAPGLVIYSQNGEVLIDLDGDGYDETGWVLFYLHLASQDRAAVGTYLKQGDPVGHPSCEGGFSESTHLHFARKYNGEWIAADGPLPLVLSGWQFHSDGVSYEGTATRGLQERVACECRQADYNGLVADR